MTLWNWCHCPPQHLIRPVSEPDFHPSRFSEPTSEPANDSTLVGKRISDYQILRCLGRGGMAEVYAAKHLSLDRKVALKILRRDLARDQDYVKRFRREAKAAARLSHPNIVGVFDVGSSDGLHFIAQEFIDGRNLQRVLEASGPLSAEDAIDTLTSVALALDQAHQAGITHRDIKPENLIRSDSGEIKVADFGLARTTSTDGDSQANLTQAGITLGTPKYMSPEQLQGRSVDTRSDLYSLGVTMYHLLSGSAPFHAEEPLALAVMHLHETPQPLDRVREVNRSDENLDLPAWLIAVVDRLMSKSPQDRFQTPKELLEAIECESPVSPVSHRTSRVSGATVRLQRASDNEQRQRRSFRRRLVVGALVPIASAAVVYWGLSQQSQFDVATSMKSTDVAKFNSIQEQYLVAATRDDEAGWQAVLGYFPVAEDAKHARTHRQVKVQMARLHARQGRADEAIALLDSVLSDPESTSLERAIALAGEYWVRVENGESRQADSDLAQLQGLSRDLAESNPEAMETLQQVLPQTIRLRLGLEK